MKRLIRLSQLASSGKKQGILPMSGATIWRKVKEGQFPKPYKLSVGVTCWDEAEVEQWLTAQQESAR